MTNFDDLRKSKLQNWFVKNLRKGKSGSGVFIIFRFVTGVFKFGCNGESLAELKLVDCNWEKSQNKVPIFEITAKKVEGIRKCKRDFENCFKNIFGNMKSIFFMIK